MVIFTLPNGDTTLLLKIPLAKNKLLKISTLKIRTLTCSKGFKEKITDWHRRDSPFHGFIVSTVRRHIYGDEMTRECSLSEGDHTVIAEEVHVSGKHEADTGIM
jgi:hypothetical protein